MNKPCARCKKHFPLDQFYAKNSSPDGKMYECKGCFKKRMKEYAKINVDKINAYKLAYYHKKKKIKELEKSISEFKTCKLCGELKSILSFYKHPTSLHGRDSYCKRCKKQMKKQRYYRDKAKKNLIPKQKESKVTLLVDPHETDQGS